MRQFLLRMEAVNLGSSIFDSEDLSTIRGGSVACLELPRRLLDAVAVSDREEVFSGASQSVMLVRVEDDVSRADLEDQMVRLAAGNIPVPGLSPNLAQVLPFISLIGVAVPFAGKLAEADAQAVARLRRRQLSQPTIDLPAHARPAASRPCDVDRMRPAVVTIKKGDDVLEVSESVAARRRLGIEGRRAIYGREAPEVTDQLTFVNSFLELVRDPPASLPPSLSGKMAVIKLDGNKFGSCRGEFIKAANEPGAAAARFSEAVVAARRRFLASLVLELAADPRMRTREGSLRFETLMWGGDESLFVLPAWKVRDMLDIIARDMAGEHWSLDGGMRLTNAYGILICSAKMPVAIAKNLAESLLSAAKSLNVKGSLENRLSMQIIESIEAPSGDVNGLRRALYRTNEKDDGAFTLSGAAELSRYLEVCDALTEHAGLPRSQLQGILAHMCNNDLLLDESVLREAVERSRPVGDDEAVRRDAERVMALLRDPVLGSAPDRPFLPFQRIAELWDLMRPFPAVASKEPH